MASVPRSQQQAAHATLLLNDSLLLPARKIVHKTVLMSVPYRLILYVVAKLAGVPSTHMHTPYDFCIFRI